ncbi:hypothetical protein CAPN004_23530 [Capnocytophaga cynodegmi]|uniref:hypothetical protein n=1 Tax=Capnocytophaga cynodegmi TaxID=28189 RepID=UPI001AC24006|nr:hypothetical protein [Capnocytophaga cynodegmi]GIM53324.1 hypothetical protein CAPN004_23530 [Capnocytophaga cynodegmi]
MKFDGIKINSERQLFEGKLVTTYDKTESNVINISVQTNKIKEILQNYKGTKKQQKELEKQVEEIKENLKKLDEALKEATDLKKEVGKFKEEVAKLEGNKNNLIEKEEKFQPDDLAKINENIEVLSNYSAKLNRKENTGGAIASVSQDAYFDGIINGVSVSNRVLSESSLLKDFQTTKPISIPDNAVSFETFEVNNEFKIIVSTSNISDNDFEKLKNETEKTKGIVVWLHYTKDKNQLKYKINYADNYFSKKQDITVFRSIIKTMLENAEKTDNWGASVIASTLGVSTMTQKMIQTANDYQEVGQNSLEIRLLEQYYLYLHDKKKRNEFQGNIIEQSVYNQDALLETAFPNEKVDSSWLEWILPKDKVEEYKMLLKNFIDKIDLSRVGVGLEKSVGAEINFGLKQEANGILGNVLFLGGEDAGYVYSYYGGEAGAGGALAAGVSVNAGGSLFVTFNTKDDYKKHKYFAGIYNYFRVEASASTGFILGGLDISAGVASTFSIGEGDYPDEHSWYVISSSGSVGVGGGVSIPGSVTGGIGKIFFINEHILDIPKTKIEKIKSYIKFIIPH